VVACTRLRQPTTRSRNRRGALGTRRLETNPSKDAGFLMFPSPSRWGYGRKCAAYLSDRYPGMRVEHHSAQSYDDHEQVCDPANVERVCTVHFENFDFWDTEGSETPKDVVTWVLFWSQRVHIMTKLQKKICLVVHLVIRKVGDHGVDAVYARRRGVKGSQSVNVQWPRSRFHHHEHNKCNQPGLAWEARRSHGTRTD